MTVQPDEFLDCEDFDYVYREHREPGSRAMDLGNDVRARFVYRKGQVVGLTESHRGPHGRECSGAVRFDVPAAEGLHGPRWQVQSFEPLTISPSVLCGCGWHGYIRDGQWVPV